MGQTDSGQHGCFVRALFGDRAIKNFDDVLEEVRWCAERPHQPDPTFWYAFGEENRDYLASLGLKPVMLDPAGFSRFGRGDEENAHHHNIIRYGNSIWRHKYPCVRDALDKYPACVWLDLDTVLEAPLPTDFWGRMAQGADFQATLQQNFRKRAGWRMQQKWPGKGPADEDARKTPAGACLYFRGLRAIEIVERLYAERPFEWDLHILARLEEELQGGQWQGLEAYAKSGIEPYCHSLGKKEGRQLFKPQERIFVTYWRKRRLGGFGESDLPWKMAGQFGPPSWTKAAK